MPIRPASEMSFSPPPRCPVCGVGILPYGQHEPLVVIVDTSGRRVYCRDHGGKIEPTYPEVLAAYQKDRMAKRQAALLELAEMNRSEEQSSSQ